MLWAYKAAGPAVSLCPHKGLEESHPGVRQPGWGAPGMVAAREPTEDLPASAAASSPCSELLTSAATAYRPLAPAAAVPPRSFRPSLLPPCRPPTAVPTKGSLGREWCRRLSGHPRPEAPRCLGIWLRGLGGHSRPVWLPWGRGPEWSPVPVPTPPQQRVLGPLLLSLAGPSVGRVLEESSRAGRSGLRPEDGGETQPQGWWERDRLASVRSSGGLEARCGTCWLQGPRELGRAVVLGMRAGAVAGLFPRHMCRGEQALGAAENEDPGWVEQAVGPRGAGLPSWHQGPLGREKGEAGRGLGWGDRWTGRTSKGVGLKATETQLGTAEALEDTLGDQESF